MLRYDLNFINLGIKEHTDIKPRNIFEIGSYNGDDSHVLAQIFELPDACCHVFEANPDAYKLLVKTYPEMNSYNYAITDVDVDEISFNVEPNNTGASSVLTKVTQTDKTKQIKVPALKMSDFIEQMNIQTIDVCKIDVEGHTLNVLKSFGCHINKLQSVQLELEHVEFWSGQALYDEISNWLKEHDFVQILFMLSRQTQSDSMWVRKNRLL